MDLPAGSEHEPEPGQGLHSLPATNVSGVGQDPSPDSQLIPGQLIQPLNVERETGTTYSAESVEWSL